MSSIGWKTIKAERPPRGEQVLVHGVVLNEVVLVLARLTRDDGVDWWEIGFDRDWRARARPDQLWARIPLPTATEGSES